MAQLSDASLFKGTILDSFETNGYISTPPTPLPPQNFFEKAKKLVSDNPKATAGALTVGGLVLDPLAFVGLVGAVGFGSGGIAAGSIAAWMMSLQGGATAAGMTGTLISSTTGVTLLGGLSALVSKKLDENPENA
ncbi:3099_t:CDS:2 [Racocetra fulgida]|uniref:3099_t:CDS:1 n=1 Tax=Racocetra fulgida TaxID=60492 RepID=A0A9N9FZP3_9GLOM|nr:3099_t:CDS:2 [Racocetra fulgida]